MAKAIKQAKRAASSKAAPAIAYEPKSIPGFSHRLGSRKGRVHQAFDKNGAEAALALAEELGIKAGSARSWMSFWKAHPGFKSRAEYRASLAKAAPKAKAGKNAKRAKKAA